MRFVTSWCEVCGDMAGGARRICAEGLGSWTLLCRKIANGLPPVLSLDMTCALEQACRHWRDAQQSPVGGRLLKYAIPHIMRAAPLCSCKLVASPGMVCSRQSRLCRDMIVLISLLTGCTAGHDAGVPSLSIYGVSRRLLAGGRPWRLTEKHAQHCMVG